ncbi:MAG: type II toxin-antitoxin system RelE/ParE family toxin [Nitrospinae bacterium]|nr:type II toxin-antitoxin system RelE/ParE family toxin [Nitrospinota bacterium]
MEEKFEIIEYVDDQGKKPFSDWLARLRDIRGVAVIDARLKRIVLGNFGDCKRMTPALWELRVDFGPGYRVYFAKDGARIVLLLCGGNKATQQRDVEKASHLWNNYRRRKHGT